MRNEQRPFEMIFPFSMAFSLALIILGLLLDGSSRVLSGMWAIIIQSDLLITDYVATAGLGAALVNTGLVAIASMIVIKLGGEPLHGFTLAIFGIMSGFALFGKNIVNMWPIILGTWLYAKYQKEPFGKYITPALLSTALAPLVTYGTYLGNQLVGVPVGMLTGLLTGILIGFVLPPLAAHTGKIQNGVNLYNMGFACGMLSMMMVPVLTGLGLKPDSVLHWADGYNETFVLMVGGLCLLLAGGGLFCTGVSPRKVLAGYRDILSTSGQAPCDYLHSFGVGPVLINMSINGALAVAYILLVDGQLNGPTIGGVLTIMGFSACGKHTGNILPIMVGVLLGGNLMHYAPNLPALQLAALFGTTLAPVSGHFGWPFGILAGFIHSALVLQTGGPVAGLNLYNNGFSGGLIAIVLYPTLTAIVGSRQERKARRKG